MKTIIHIRRNNNSQFCGYKFLSTKDYINNSWVYSQEFCRTYKFKEPDPQHRVWCEKCLNNEELSLLILKYTEL